MRFEVVRLKSASGPAYQVLSRGALRHRKAEYCNDTGELAQALARYASVQQYPLVQAYCPGHGLGHMIFMHNQQPVLRFQHRRVAEWPPEGGSSTVCESLPLTDNAELFEKSVALLRAIDWQGAAMVEYRFDPRTGQAMLMEINGRFWGSLPLASHAGAEFGWYTYAMLGLGRQLTQPAYTVGLRCRYMIPETKRIVRLWRDGGRTPDRQLTFDARRETLGFLAQFFRPRTRYFVFSLQDPMPCVRDLAAAAVKAVKPTTATRPVCSPPRGSDWPSAGT
jgi:predicted ATP-grasp superfamily ATP-dependent carboligase